jgi:hypothetical protein
VLNRYQSTSSGAAVLTDVPVGAHPLQVFAQGYRDSDGVVNVTVTAGQQTAVTVTLNRVASVKGKVVNAAGAPVAGVCVVPTLVPHLGLPDGCGYGTDAAGEYLMPVWNGAGDYRLFAIPEESGPYGAQWVGPAGGTGDPRQAAVITVPDGQWVTAPTIKLDRAGTITGAVTSETGQPIEWGSVNIYAFHPGAGPGYGHASLDENGRYSTDFLGPYSWPLLFHGQDHATQWSGGAPDRFSAQTIKVTSDATTTYNYTMKVGSLIKGTFKLADGSALDGQLIAAHWSTREPLGITEVVDGTYQLRVITPVPVSLGLETYDEVGGNLQGPGRMYFLGDTTFNFCGVSATTFGVCGGLPPRRPGGQP